MYTRMRTFISHRHRHSATNTHGSWHFQVAKHSEVSTHISCLIVLFFLFLLMVLSFSLLRSLALILTLSIAFVSAAGENDGALDKNQWNLFASGQAFPNNSSLGFLPEHSQKSFPLCLFAYLLLAPYSMCCRRLNS